MGASRKKRKALAKKREKFLIAILDLKINTKCSFEEAKDALISCHGDYKKAEELLRSKS